MRSLSERLLEVIDGRDGLKSLEILELVSGDEKQIRNTVTRLKSRGLIHVKHFEEWGERVVAVYASGPAPKGHKPRKVAPPKPVANAPMGRYASVWEYGSGITR